MLSGTALQILSQGPIGATRRAANFAHSTNRLPPRFLPETTGQRASRYSCKRLSSNSTHVARRNLATDAPSADKIGSGSLSALYQQKVKSGTLRYDKCQENTISRLDPLRDAVLGYEEAYYANGFPDKIRLPQAPSEKKSSGMWSFMKGTISDWTEKEEIQPPRAPKGFYMYGDVGSGKTMLMDLFLEGTPLRFKQRVHFNSFMIDFHNSLHKWRQSPQAKGVAQSAAIESIADSILSKSPLLCFDEFQVTNIADAMILNRLFHTLWYKGAVVIATSNRPPEELYKGGLQRENFVPFIHELNGQCIIHDIGSATDYRLLGQRTGNIWNVQGKVGSRSLLDIWNSLTEHRPGEPSELILDGRKLHVPRAMKGIAMFSFYDLCDRPLGSADYGLLAREYHTLLLSDIPILSLQQRDLVRRFITLVDELYEHRVKVICSADGEMKDIFPYHIDASMRNANTLIAGEEEIFAFSRTLSRLSEMQTTEYLESRHIKDPSIRPTV